jgi:glutaredoxin
VVVYAMTFCPSSRLVRRLFADRSIPFSYVELDALPVRQRKKLAATIVKETGADTLPVTRVAGRFVVGFKPSELMSAVESLKGK